MDKWLRVLLELLPVQVFALSWRWHGSTSPDGWMVPYAAGALTAVICTSFLVWRRVMLDRLLLGVNTGIFLAALGLYCKTPGLPALLHDMQGAGFFVMILLTAGFTYISRPAALLNFEQGQFEPWDKYMLLAVLVAFFAAFVTRSAPLVNAFLLAMLFVVRSSLQNVAVRTT
ncbi:hypothetical protein [Oleidesulfovibrio sp.]|uniref:hypothetical protein n=1 Tax=Oleidesulfovibrio sp. TaxID=2909707 RepID=UPI003A88B934